MASGKGYDEQLYKLRHSTAHVMAEAVLEMFPEGKLAFGPPIENGFYYDFDLARPLTPEDLVEIEARMKEIIHGNYPFVHRELSVDEAKAMFAEQPYKIEQIEKLALGEEDEDGMTGGEAGAEPVSRMSVYEHRNFADLCRGPHLDNTGQIPVDAFKLLNVAGAYWRGDENQPMLQRIYGTVWEAHEELEDHLWRLEEAARRDHRKLGRQLDLFSIQEAGGPGLICWHPKGARIRRLIEEFWYQEHERGGYEIVYTPHVGKGDLWSVSGHLDFYQENMYAPMDVEGQDYFIKPMNCPYQILVYKSRRRSYRELPLRWAELGTVYRYERSGVLHGLLRVRGFTIDDAHIICRPDQVEDEIIGVYDFSLSMLRAFGFPDLAIYLATRPEKYVGVPERWDQAQQALERALEVQGLPYEVDDGGGAFYGPKIDIKVKDALGREWQTTTIQFDFNLPERFDMTYVGEDGQEHQPYVVHRALLGSLERFFGTLIEHYGGAFPAWLSPVQAIVIPIADRHNDYAQEVAARLKAAGLRIEVNDSSDRMQAKIRDAQLQKVPYMLVIGDREVKDDAVAVRLRSGEDLGAQSVSDFISMAQAAVAERRDL
ncbi:MAG TPA: threonine--tRNA ligase [Anaerolineae bacterium]|nr:threonine--tRNA ligase [Anaerolineae bacterium]